MTERDQPERRKPEIYRETRVEFLGEQDGLPEQDLKRQLSSLFVSYPAISHAYLAVVGYQPTDERSVALCLISQEPGDEALVEKVGDVFAKSFGRDVRLDIMFVDSEQHSDLQRVCRPFFVLSGRGDR